MTSCFFVLFYFLLLVCILMGKSFPDLAHILTIDSYALTTRDRILSIKPQPVWLFELASLA